MVEQWPEIKAASRGLQNVARGISSSLCGLGLTGFRVMDDSTLYCICCESFSSVLFFSYNFTFKKRIERCGNSVILNDDNMYM